MLGSPVPASATTQTSASSATSATPARPSRLRGLSYLRSYTRDHLHSSSSATNSPRTESPPLIRSTSSPANSPRTTRSRANSDSPVTSTVQPATTGRIIYAEGQKDLDQNIRQRPTASAEITSPEQSAHRPSMTRSRAVPALGPTPTTTTTASTSVTAERATSPAIPTATSDVGQHGVARDAASRDSSTKEAPPSIRFIPHIETRSSRPSLQFAALSKTLKNINAVVRVGRYSERDISSPDENVIPVGFKSKVVSRRHCEFWCHNGQWYVKDVKSSSGTFLNHVRLSAPGAESRPFPVNDGDVIQLGIDFKGGEEIIFRCVKIRVECNRGWQKSLNNFNTTAHKRILRNAVQNKVRDSDAGSVNNSECSICLNPVSPCQALFVAPCGHLWHYKCIRNLIHGPNYPNFLCPNCRLVADLDADVEPPEDELYDEDLGPDSSETPPASGPDRPQHSADEPMESISNDQIQQERAVPAGDIINEDLAHLADETSIDLSGPAADETSPEQANDESDQTPTGTKPVAIATPSNSRHAGQDFAGAKSATPTTHMQFALAASAVSADLMTPRNDAGPFIFDGNDDQTRQNILSQRARSEEE